MIGLTYKGKLKKNEKLNLNKKRRDFVIFNTRSFSTVYDKNANACESYAYFNRTCFN